MNELSWFWIVLMMTAPALLGVLVAFPFWRTRQMILGNIAGTVAIFAVAFALICREYVELDRLTQRCLDAGVTCWPVPSACFAPPMPLPARLTSASAGRCAAYAGIRATFGRVE